MDQSELIERFRVRGYSKRAAVIILKDIREIVEEALANGESVALRGLGTFSVRRQEDKVVTDVQTKERRISPAHMIPKFSPSAHLRQVCRQGFVS